MPSPIRILHLEDSSRDAALIRDLLDAGGGTYEVFCAANRKEFEEALEQPAFDLIICDFNLPDYGGLSALKLAKEKYPETPVIIVSGAIDAGEAGECLKRGATDYLLKQRLERLPSAVLRALEEAKATKLRQQAEARLRESEARFRQLAEHIDEVFWLKDLPTNRIIYVSPAYETVWGRTCMSLYVASDTWLDAIHPEDRERVLQAALSKQTAGTYDEEFRIVRPDGKIRWILDRAFPVKDPSGVVYRIAGVACDITERKQAERTNSELAKKLDATLRAIPDLLFELDEHGRYCDVWAQNEAQLAQPRERLIGRTIRDVLPPDAALVVFDALRHAAKTGASRGQQFRLPLPVGMLWFELSTARKQASPGEPLRFLMLSRDITERKLAEEERKQLAEVLEASLNEIYIIDAQTLRFDYVNACARHNLGYAMDAMRKMTPVDLKPELSEASFSELIGPLRRHEKSKIVFQTVHRRADGSLYPVEVHLQFVERGGKAVFLAIINDITERKLADETLRQSTARLQEAQRVARLGNWDWDITTNDLYWSDEIYRIFGLTPQQFGATYSAFLERVHPLDRSRVMAAVDAAVHAAAPYDLDHRIVLPDGRERTVHETGHVFRDEAGRPLRMVGTVQDITERKAAEEQIHEQAELLNKARDAIIVAGLDNRIVFWNHSAERITGWLAAEALGKTGEELFGTPGAFDRVRSVVSATGAWQGEFRLRRKNGEFVVLDFSTTLILDETGQPKSRLHIGTDITEKKQLEEQALRAQRLESLGMLATGIAHDLNNVLAPILIVGPLLRGSLHSPHDLRTLDILERSAERGAGLVRQIVAFSHGTTGEPQLTQIKHLARDVANLVEGTFPKTIRLEHSIPSELWPAVVNPTQIHQVLLNLCVNARDAMPRGGTLRVSVTNRRLNDMDAQAIPGARPGLWLMLEVADNGAGIPPEVLPRIWDPFFTTKAPGKGTGLGLSTVRGIVSNHLGFIQLETSVGKGATFRVFLPAVTTELSCADTVSPATELHGGGEFILIVDDDQAVREIVAAILSQHGYRVATCANGIEAITIFNAQSGEFALVITDVDMPELGGAVLARVLLQLRPDVRLLAMSGLSGGGIDGSDAHTVKQLAHAFLLKPFLPENLLCAVRRLLHPPAKT